MTVLVMIAGRNMSYCVRREGVSIIVALNCIVAHLGQSHRHQRGFETRLRTLLSLVHVRVFQRFERQWLKGWAAGRIGDPGVGVFGGNICGRRTGLQ